MADDSGSTRPPLVVIVGPTGVGKTSLSLKLAALIGGEIVSADSRLFYQGMDVGTDKPSLTERLAVPHHLIDICRPNETVTLGQYQRLAYAAIDKILRATGLPILVGGTGQYVWAVVEGWGIPTVAPQTLLREALADLGQTELSRWLDQLDPVSARKIDSRNVRRVIRALEVTLVTGRPMSVLQRKTPPNFEIKIIGLTGERTLLYQRVDKRVDQMMKRGLLEEVKSLQQAGYGNELPSMSGLGYRQLYGFLADELSLEEAVQRIKYETHRFIRQQYTWFRLDNPAIAWFDIGSAGWNESAEKHVVSWLKQRNES